VTPRQIGERLGDAPTMDTPTMDTPTIPMIVSVDDHVVEPAHVWQVWLPERYRDRGPRIERRGLAGLKMVGPAVYEYDFDDDAPPCDIWFYEDLIVPHKRHVAAVGFDRDDMTLSPITYDEMRPGCYEPKARVDDMLMNHVDASLCFPTFPRFCGQTFLEAKDRELAMACVVAYNDWMVEEWCGESRGVLIPLTIVPLWDVAAAAAEVRRNAARGVHAVCFSEIPPHLGLPSIHTGEWDPFFAACAETHTVVCMHIGSSSKMPAASPDAPPSTDIMLSFNNSMASLADYLFSGVLVRFPELKLAYSEGQIGWIPYALERADNTWEYHSNWTKAKETIPEPPSTYYRGRIFGCFTNDVHGVASINEVGEDNVCFETDYPHTDTTWPFSRAEVERMTASLTDAQRYKVLRGNAIRMLDLDRV
jgi:predicted TIM-barrel fold metal-dependent hydrolase